MIFVGVDWAEDHHDVCLLDEQGANLGKRRVPEGLDGSRQLQELIAEHTEGPEQVVIGIETDRGLLVRSLLASGYQLYAINPLAVDRYRDRLQNAVVHEHQRVEELTPGERQSEHAGGEDAGQRERDHDPHHGLQSAGACGAFDRTG